MLTPKLQQLATAKAKVEELEKKLSAERNAVLRRLHTEVGYSSREDLIAALRGLDGAGAGRGRPKAAASTSAGRKRGKRKARAKITPEIREQIIAAVKGGSTGNQVAQKFGVSLPTVQNIKRDAGLTRKRRGK
jgi:transposase